MAQYVLREFMWAYNDETFTSVGGRLHIVYEDERSANDARAKLEVAHWKEMNLGETDAFFNGGNDMEARQQEIDDFVFKKTGKRIFAGNDYHSQKIPNKLSAEDTCTFLK